MYTAVLLAALTLGRHAAQAFVAAPWALGAVSTGAMSSVCGAGNQCALGGSTQRRELGVCMATSSELDQSAEYVKAELARVQEENGNKTKKIQEQTRQAAARGDAAVTPLAELEFIPFVDEEGKVTSMDTTGVKASVYAVYDESKTMRFIGVSRGIQQMPPLILSLPSPAQVQHIARPSRSLLEVIKDSWVEENGSTPAGNVDAASQAVWESSMNVIPLMTEEDKALVATFREKGKDEMGIKKIARRFEAEIFEALEKRGVTEPLRFDPKLKGKGLLDVMSAARKPDTAVPK
ncbi:unnamed protein product [Scytosiphon promiscuus]